MGLSKEDILNIMKKNNGILTSSMLDSYNISSKKMQRMAQVGEVERPEKGLYLHPDFLEDEFYITGYRVPKGVFSHESSLYLHKLSDENPTLLTLTIPSGWNSPLLKNKEKYTFFYLKKNLWELGQEKIKTPYGNTVLVYSKERTLAEMIGKMDKSDRSLVLQALRLGLKNNLLDRALLLDYAEYFKSRTLTRTYLEAIE
ncbi:MAG: hypothetical protein Q3993_05580 [Filifactor alocis]|nr:hypothetical protein [Filifactor alocis]